MASNPLGIVWVHDGFGGGTDGNLFLQLGGTSSILSVFAEDSKSRVSNLRVSNPGDLSRESLDVVLLLIEHVLGDEQRERAISHTHFPNLVIEVFLDLLPDEKGMRLPEVSTARRKVNSSSVGRRTVPSTRNIQRHRSNPTCHP